MKMVLTPYSLLVVLKRRPLFQISFKNIEIGGDERPSVDTNDPGFIFCCGGDIFWRSLGLGYVSNCYF